MVHTKLNFAFCLKHYHGIKTDKAESLSLAIYLNCSWHRTKVKENGESFSNTI